MTLPQHRPHGGLCVLAVVLALLGGCGRAEPADTPAVLLAEGLAGDQQWRLEGRRLRGEPCVTLVVERREQSAAERCGIRRTPLRHLEPAVVPVGSRLLVFSPVAASTRQVRLDTTDGAIRIEPARPAPGFPARFFLVDLDAGNVPLAVRTFADGGRALVT